MTNHGWLEYAVSQDDIIRAAFALEEDAETFARELGDDATVHLLTDARFSDGGGVRLTASSEVIS